MMHIATRCFALLFMSGVLACGMDMDQPGGGAEGGGGAGGDGAEWSGDVQSGTYNGTIRLTAKASIPAGAEVVIAAGSEIVAADGASLSVAGSLLVDGSADQTVSIEPEEGSAGWVGIAAESSGQVTIRHATGSKVATLLNCKAGAATCALQRVDFTDVGRIVSTTATATLAESRVVKMENGGVYVNPGGNLTVSDTELNTSLGDIVVAAGGTLVVEYSTIGGTLDTYEHCQLHVGRADSLTVRYSNIITGKYGMMIGGVAGAVVNYNNFEGNDPTDIDPLGQVTGADFRHNFWDKGAPTSLGGEFDVSAAEPAHIDQAGPRI
jgi:hypothetical protein